MRTGGELERYRGAGRWTPRARQRRLRGTVHRAWARRRRRARCEPRGADRPCQRSLLHDGAGRSAQRRRPSSGWSADRGVHLEQAEAGWSITRIELHTTGEVEGVDAASFERLAQQAKVAVVRFRARSPARRSRSSPSCRTSARNHENRGNRSRPREEGAVAGRPGEGARRLERRPFGLRSRLCLPDRAGSPPA